MGWWAINASGCKPSFTPLQSVCVGVGVIAMLKVRVGGAQ